MMEVAVNKVMTDDVVMMDDVYVDNVAIDMENGYMGEMPGDIGIIEPEQGGFINSTVILWITIIVCAILGIALGVIFGRKSAMK